MFYCLIQIELVNVSVWLKQGIQWICIWPSSFTLALHVKPEVYLCMWIPVYIILSCILIQLLHSNMTNLNDVRLSWWCRWRHTSSGMWCCVGGTVLLDISENCAACIFRNKHSLMGGLLVPEDDGNSVLPASCPWRSEYLWHNLLCTIATFKYCYPQLPPRTNTLMTASN